MNMEEKLELNSLSNFLDKKIFELELLKLKLTLNIEENGKSE
ncbi:hypothetical protein [Allomuricauda sp. CAU 1633]|nr:hypothetical protein [Muricauda sp. CAU 1633]